MNRKLLLATAFFLPFLGFSQEKTSQPKNNQVFLKVQDSKSVDSALRSFILEHNLPRGTTFQSTQTNIDRNGFQHDKFQQYHQGIQVEFGVALVHSKEGKAYLVNGEVYQVSTPSQAPSLSANEAFLKAKNYVNASVYLWEDAQQAELMKYSKPEGELVYFPNLETKEAHLAYKFDVFATQPLSRQIVYVDAISGAIVLSNPIIKHANQSKCAPKGEKYFGKPINSLVTPGNADTRYNGTQVIETMFNGTNYVLQDNTRGNGIVTYNSQDTATFQSVDFTDSDNNWTAAEHDNIEKDNGALDAHWGAAVTYDFFQNYYGRNSYDDNGAVITSYVHFGDYDNASWSGSAMIYGDGDNYDIFTALDICGHEVAHAVCQYTADLVYQYESGALNEGFSDIWGACIEHYGRTGGLTATVPSAIWEVGEDIGVALRSMSNPGIYGDPDTYNGTNWYTGSGDNGGVHTNSGVLNYWFYLLSQGGSGTNSAPVPDTYSVTGIGMTDAAEIAYLAERDYLTPNATFADARLATIEVANLLHCANSPQAMAVTNAWYAVNVGDEYVAADFDMAVASVEENTSIACGNNSFTTNVVVKNYGTTTITSATILYAIDGGTAVSQSWTGTLQPCEEATIALTINAIPRGTHLLEVTTVLANDQRPENDSKSVSLYSNDAGVINTVNTFTNTNTDELITYNEEGTTPWMISTRTTGSILSDEAYMINDSDDYPNNLKTYLVSQCYDLTNIGNPEISFSMNYDLEFNWDIVYVEYTTDMGANWQVLGEMATNWYNSDRTYASSGNNDCTNCPGAQWTGTNSVDTTYSYPLNSLSSFSNVIFRIVFHSDVWVTAEGVNIDNFLISGTLSSDDFIQNQEITVYPVPSKGVFSIESKTETIQKVEVFDLTGKLILEQNFSNNANQIDISDAANGVYFVKIQVLEKSIVKRIIKQ